MDDIERALFARHFDDMVDAADDAADEARRWLEWLRHALGVQPPPAGVRHLSSFAARSRKASDAAEKRMLARAAKSG